MPRNFTYAEFMPRLQWNLGNGRSPVEFPNMVYSELIEDLEWIIIYDLYENLRASPTGEIRVNLAQIQLNGELETFGFIKPGLLDCICQTIDECLNPQPKLLLCFIKDNCAYFTSNTLEKQSGYDWDKAPYAPRAGEPYKQDGLIVKVYFDSHLVFTNTLRTDAPYSILQINREKIVPWLSNPKDIRSGLAIYAGTKLSDFIILIRDSGGKVYCEV